MMDITERPFGLSPDGTAVTVYTLRADEDFWMDVTNFGGIVMSLYAPDRHGMLADIVLGFDDLDSYIAKHPYFGSIVGRYANRIAGGHFMLDGKRHVLAKNNGENHLHGGVRGFDKAVWRAEPFQTSAGVGLKLKHLSPDGDEGYPGNLLCEAIYGLSARRELSIAYTAHTDAPTHVNLTHHGYFNLNGHDSGDILGHRMQIFADCFTPIADNLIPTGELRSVTDTPLDFRAPVAIGERINADDEQLKFGMGYDHNYVVNRSDNGLVRAAKVVSPQTGRVLEAWTTEPGMQFYCGNFLDGSNVGKGGAVYRHRNGFCLETQHFPDTPNQPGFPLTLLRPGETYHTKTVYRFSAD